MESDCPDDYPLVGVEPHIGVPPRSVLASLKPMGLGTPYRESLSSYFIALAHLHVVTPKNLAREIIVPRMVGNERRTDDTFKLWKLPLFNGIGTVPETWAKHLSELTGQTNLIDLTLVSLRPYTSVHGLMSTTKKWCPLCLSEAAHEGRVYGQLLWELDVVKACPRHGFRLVSRCRCNRSSVLSPLNIKHLTGLCDSCGRSLLENNEEFIEDASEDEVSRAQIVADLLGGTGSLQIDIDPAARISVFLNAAVQHFTGGNAALFGRLLGIRKNTLHGWMHSQCIPTFPQIVDIAFACRCSIADVMLGDQDAFKELELLNSQPTPRKYLRAKRTQKLDRVLIQRQLEMLSNEDPPISVAMAAGRIGVNRRTLFGNFGNITKKISRRFRAHRHSEKIRKFKAKCDLYRQSAENLFRQGIRPTRRLVGLDIKGKSSVIKEEEQAACSRICKEVIHAWSGS